MPEITDISKGSIIAVGMSGGVDSTMTAQFLVEQGYQVIGLTMKIWDGSFELKNVGHSGCFGPGEIEDLAAAEVAASQIGISHHVVDLTDYYKHAVLDYFRAEYLAGRTPNPCVRCNHMVKFGALLDQAKNGGIHFDYFATGHYARTKFDSERKRYVLLRGVDSAKDQSYFLSRLNQSQLAKLILPLGNMTKHEVKEVAHHLGWRRLAEMHESQDFIESGDYSVLFERQDYHPGPIVDGRGNVLGEHQGIIRYTIGQRKGLGIGGAKEPLYVVRIDAASNTLHVGTHAELFSAGLKADNLNWIALDATPETPRRIEAKIRLRHKAADALLVADMEKHMEQIAIHFNQPQSAITPGQVVVFYDGDLVLGSGEILSS